MLGLLALAWALLAAPLLHRAAHAHGHAHRHAGDAPAQPHGQGSLEHQLAVFTAPALAAVVSFFVVARRLPRVAAPRPVVLVARRLVARAQAP